MNLEDLKRRLVDDGFNPLSYCIGSDWSARDDAYCLDHAYGQFEVFYVERGQKRDVLVSTRTEAEACDSLLSTLKRERFSRAHCVISSAVADHVDQIADRLRSSGIEIHRDTIPYGGSTDMRHRIFVFGNDRNRAEEIVREAN